MPFEQDAQKACARPIGRKKPNYDYNKNKKVRPLDIVVLSSDEDDPVKKKNENVIIVSSDDERGDFSLLGAPLSRK